MHEGGDWVLYDLQNDPYQMNNLVSDPAHAERKETLRRRLVAMRKELGEDLPMSGPERGRGKKRRKRKMPR
jgi:hypothetical protein